MASNDNERPPGELLAYQGQGVGEPLLVRSDVSPARNQKYRLTATGKRLIDKEGASDGKQE